jgi:hypothetical protein
MAEDRPDATEIQDLEAAARHRREADRSMSMSERLAALHELCRQLESVDGAAQQKLRATRDLDVVPDHDPENLQRLATALRDLEAILPLAKRPFDAFRSPASRASCEFARSPTCGR